jgi:hypothetical protein
VGFGPDDNRRRERKVVSASGKNVRNNCWNSINTVISEADIFLKETEIKWKYYVG